jgi:hypothetical protein
MACDYPPGDKTIETIEKILVDGVVIFAIVSLYDFTFGRLVVIAGFAIIAAAVELAYRFGTKLGGNS